MLEECFILIKAPLNCFMLLLPAECFLQLMPSKTSKAVQYPILRLFFSKTWQKLCLSIKEGKKFICTGKSGRPESPTGHTQKKKTPSTSPTGLNKERLSWFVKDPRARIYVLLGLEGNLSSIHSHALENPSVSFLPNVPHRVNHHPNEVSSSLPWDFGCCFFPPCSYFCWLGLRLD